MKVLLNYANELYAESQKRCSESGRKFKFDKVYEFTSKDIEENYYLKHNDILDIKRGNGLWLWKPYFIKKVLSTLNDGDILFYLDSGSFFFRSPKPVFDILENGGGYMDKCTPFKRKTIYKKRDF